MLLTANVILVLGSERLYSDMMRRFSTSKTDGGDVIRLVKLDKSGGCVDRDDAFMHQLRDATIKEYFFGDAKRTLSPHTQVVSFDELSIFKIREGMQCPLQFPILQFRHVFNKLTLYKQTQCITCFSPAERRKPSLHNTRKSSRPP